ncbi:MAG: flippase-like domain-containing protein [Sphingomonas sp.]|nr:flippase-like domain-containing protein [Sphingomonas sp.]
MKRFLIVGTVLLIAVAGLVWSGIKLGDIGRAVALVGWGIALAIAARYVVTLLLAYASWVIMPADQRPALWESAAIRIVRDTVNTLLPTTQIGGDIVAARLMLLCGVAAPMAAAGVVTDLFIQVVTQFLFALGGTLLLLQLGASESIVRTVASGLLIAAPTLIAFYFIQRLGVGQLIVTALKKLAGGKEWAAFAATDAFYAALARIRERRGAMATSAIVHLSAWLLGSIEVYVIFGFMGHPVTVAEAIVIESIGQAVRGAAFAVPGAIGVQEGAFVVLCGGFGIPADAALAMSLIKRIADVAIGAPGFLFWYRFEGRRGARGGGVASPD